MNNQQRISLLSSTDPRGAMHHQWQIKFNWGELLVQPSGELDCLHFHPKGVPEKLISVIDELLSQYARCKINSFELGQSLIKKALQQIEES